MGSSEKFDGNEICLNCWSQIGVDMFPISKDVPATGVRKTPNESFDSGSLIPIGVPGLSEEESFSISRKTSSTDEGRSSSSSEPESKERDMIAPRNAALGGARCLNR